jgi:hypothetical protein
MLRLGITGYAASNLETMRESFVTMQRFGVFLVIPAGVLAVAAGSALGLGTRWGLVRHYWVSVKLLLSLVALTLVVFALLPELHQAASMVTKADVPAHAGFVGTTMVIAPSAALAIYTCNVVLSVFKPRGRTTYGKRAAPALPEVYPISQSGTTHGGSAPSGHQPREKAQMSDRRYLKPPWMQRHVGNRMAVLFRPGLIAKLSTRGRRSGNWRTVPVVVLDHNGERYLVSYRGASDWALNLRASPTARLTRHGQAERSQSLKCPSPSAPPCLRPISLATARCQRSQRSCGPFPTLLTTRSSGSPAPARPARPPDPAGRAAARAAAGPYGSEPP